MKRIVLILAIIIGSVSANAAVAKRSMRFDQKEIADKKIKGIQFFKGTWEEALAKAKSENKLIFLDAYASWCGPCKMMAANTFTDESVGTFFNKNFINVKMDMEKSKHGQRLSNKYRLTAYPTLFFIDGKEEAVYKTVGYLKAKQLIAQGQLALKQ